MEDAIKLAKEFLIRTIKKERKDPFHILDHVTKVENWARYILSSHPEADKTIVLMGVWLHDIGHYPLNGLDHSITGEKRAINFLNKIKFDKAKSKKIAHCIRAHRCKDIQPETIEAKIVACADSASHFTSYVYLDIILKNLERSEKYNALDKLNRDYRDVSIFPEVKKDLEPLYHAWKGIIIEFEKINNILNKNDS